MSNSLIDLPFLKELDSTGAKVKFRLPSNIPELPTPFRGLKLNARGLIAVINKAVGLLSLAENDYFCAENERTMSLNKNINSTIRLHHRKREKVLRDQASRRQVISYALFMAVAEAQYV
jgi:hypothetical protein